MTPRVALDLTGGDAAPDATFDGALLVADERPDIQVVLVGPEQVAARWLSARGASGRFEVVNATESVGMAEDPVRAVRAKRDATVRVAARLVRDGAADATVSAGSTGAALAAAVFTLGRLPGVTRPALAVVVPARTGPVVLVDAGACPDAGPDLLAQFALTGAAYAATALGIADPRVGLLSNGAEPGKGDGVRRAAYDAIAALPVTFAGNVEGHDVVLGGPADVVVTDGFTGNVLLKGIEGALALAGATGRLDPERHGGAVLLGVDGVAVVGHGGSSPRAVASCVELAADTVRAGLLPRLTTTLTELVQRRRAAAGLVAQGAL